MNIRPPSDSDGESSDGGEYIPNEEDEEEEEEDSYLLDTDGVTEPDAEMEELDLSVYQNWEPDDEMDDGSSEWGLTDGDSFSDGEPSLESEEVSLHNGA